MKTKPMDQKKDPRDSISFLSQTNPHKRAGKEKEPQKIFLKNSKTTRSMKNGGGRPPEPRPLPSFPAPKMVNVDTSKVTRLALGPAATRNREKKTFGRNSLRFPFLPPPVCPPAPTSSSSSSSSSSRRGSGFVSIVGFRRSRNSFSGFSLVRHRNKELGCRR